MCNNKKKGSRKASRFFRSVGFTQKYLRVCLIPNETFISSETINLQKKDYEVCLVSKVEDSLDYIVFKLESTVRAL